MTTNHYQRAEELLAAARTTADPDIVRNLNIGAGVHAILAAVDAIAPVRIMQGRPFGTNPGIVYDDHPIDWPETKYDDLRDTLKKTADERDEALDMGRWLIAEARAEGERDRRELGIWERTAVRQRADLESGPIGEFVFGIQESAPLPNVDDGPRYYCQRCGIPHAGDTCGRSADK